MKAGAGELRYRFEYKYLISAQTAQLLRGRVSAALRPDIHGEGFYTVNNIYLDDRYDSYYYAKYAGRFRRD